MKKIILSLALGLLGQVGYSQTFPVQNLQVNGTSMFTGQATFTLSPTAPTPTVGDSSTKLATTAFVAGAATATAATNTILKTFSTLSQAQVWRYGVNTIGDAPPLLFAASGSPCVLNAGAGDTGSQVPSSNGLCWVAVYGSDAVDAREFGIDLTGTNDSTTQLQAAWNYAGTIQQDLQLPGTPNNGYIKFSQITMPTPLDFYGLASSLVGQGGNGTVLKSTVTGTQCAISMTANFNGPSYAGNRTGGWELWSLNSAGYGLCLNGITYLTTQPFTILNFTFGMYAIDSIRITLNRPAFINGQRALYANIGTNSYPNDWNINAPWVTGQTQDGFLIFAPSDFNIRGGDFEAVNVANAGGFCTINIAGNPVNGTKGLAITGGYYQDNGGVADVCIAQNASGPGSGPGIHSITGVEFGRISNVTFVTHEVNLTNANGAAQTIISMHGNSFNSFNSYAPNAGRTYWAVSNAAGANYKLTDYGDNRFGNLTEAPGNCFATNATACVNLPDGHIEQWGQATAGSGGTGFPVAVTWPVVCPTAVDSVVTTAVNAGGPYTTGVGTSSTTGTTLYAGTASVAIGWRMLCH